MRVVLKKIKGTSITQDSIVTTISLVLLIGSGLLFILFFNSAIRIIILMWAFACLAVGGFTGFLFGIPRVLQGYESDFINQQSLVSGANTNTKIFNTNGSQIEYRQRVNTNIEQISDWLTKIIVGIGLVELKNIPDLISRASSFLAEGIIISGIIQFCFGVIVYFTVVGFISGYLITRLYLAPAFSSIESASSLVPKEFQDTVNDIEYENLVFNPQSFNDEDRQFDKTTIITARKITRVPLNEIKTLSGAIAWAKAQLSLGNYSEAIAGYKKAIELDPRNINLYLEYSIALYFAKKDVQEVKEQLEKAYKLLTNDVDKTLKKDVYKHLTYYALYGPEPSSFNEAIRYGEEYIHDKSNLPSASIWMNLAAAYGQKFRYITNHPNYTGDTTDEYDLDKSSIRAKALEAIQKAIQINSRVVTSLRLLLQSNAIKQQGEDDLEVFENDNDFRRTLGLAPTEY